MTIRTKLIADNGGGITLQVTDGNCLYQHTYDGNCDQLVEDLRDVTHFRGWEGNEITDDENTNDQWLRPTSDELRNGGYRIIDLDNLDVNASWSNIAEFAKAAKKQEKR